ncbi:protein phosphatase 1 regulatory inhibitor subunit PPP1R8 homolog [Andrographis paniculata]|uniref:protein phosphatase 1 regulatory inhibitor subunit PPP1R8 homolog n=1 Tax=Andrographis paniculata TaxID=175694 RepID=UPI0021E6D8D6|nr:protein phosphatase 1 regulatory inhibitor subunit PPP1R8 homolog [Andrographis paniculata]
MYGRAGLDRFKKAQSSEPFSVTGNSAAAKSAAVSALTESHNPRLTVPSANQTNGLHAKIQFPNHQNVAQNTVTPDPGTNAALTQQVTQVGGGQSSWQPPDWAIEPRPGVYYLDVVKEGEVIGQINLDKRKHIFGRQFHTCDFVLDHQSVSRQHAAVVPHKNGSIYVIDLGSAHGTFVANERLTKDTPVELESGQSLRFAASTRTYILRKNNAALFPPPQQPAEINLPPPPDPSDEEAVLTYNTYVNRFLNGLKRADALSKSDGSKNDSHVVERASKRIRRTRVAFKDQVGGQLVEVVGYSDGADVETEPGPVGVKEGSSLVGKYESLVQVTVIPKGKEQPPGKEVADPQTGVTEKLKQVLNKVKSPANSKSGGGIYDDLYGESFPEKVGGSWAFSSVGSSGRDTCAAKKGGNAESVNKDDDDDDDDLFG